MNEGIIETQEYLRSAIVDRSYTLGAIALSTSELRLFDGCVVVRSKTPTSGLVFDHPTLGLLDAGNFYDGDASVFSVEKVLWPNDVFRYWGTAREDSLLYVSGAATRDTSGQTVSFTAAQTLVLRVYKGSGTVLSASVAVDEAALSSVSLFTFAVSADGGSTWTTVDNGSTYTFAPAERGSDLQFRVTCSGTGTVSFVDAYGKRHPFRVVFSKA